MLVRWRAKSLAAVAVPVASFAVVGCAGQTAPVVVEQPVAVAPQFSVNEQDFIDLARQSGGFDGYYDDEVLEMGNQACDELEVQPEVVFNDFDPSFVSLAVTTLCPELHDNYVYLTQ